MWGAPLAWVLAGVLLALPASAEEDNPPPEPLAPADDETGASVSGALAYRVPINVPRGRGPTPRLALVYSSQQGNRASILYRPRRFPGRARQRRHRRPRGRALVALSRGGSGWKPHGPRGDAPHFGQGASAISRPQAAA